MRIERQFTPNLALGLNLLGSFGHDEMSRFESSRVKDSSVQVSAYGRARLTDDLRLGAFGGFGRSWYDVQLDQDGFAVRGSLYGNRVICGASLAGDIPMGSITATTEAALSHARETLAGASLSAAYAGETRTNIAYDFGSVDATRLSVPVKVPLNLLSGDVSGNGAVHLMLEPGLLCENITEASSTSRCGY
jgi:hypothetical protein